MKISAPLLGLALSASSFLGVDARMHRQHSHRDLAQRYKRDNVAYAALMYWGHQDGEAGACGQVHRDDQLLVGLQTTMYGMSNQCGKFVEIRNTANNMTVTAPVYDSCDGCTDSNDLVSSIHTFQALGGNLDAGVLDVVWTFVDAPSGNTALPASNDDVKPAPKQAKKQPVAQEAASWEAPKEDKPEPVQPEKPAPVLKQANIENEDDCEEWDKPAEQKPAEEKPAPEEKKYEEPKQEEAPISSWSEPASTAAESSWSEPAPAAESSWAEPAPAEESAAPAPELKKAVKVESNMLASDDNNNDAPAPSAEGFKLTHDLRGQELLNFFNFEQKSGDNGGFANWVQDGSLQYVNDKGNVVFATDATPVVDSRKTTRAVSKDTFNKGLFISRITHMPATYGSWPSFWMVSNKAWPEGGEIDILEGVGSFSQNAASVHTTAGCSMPVSALEQTTSKFMLSGPQQTNCDTHATDSQGCGLRDDTPNTFGPGFNNVGGAYVAVHITDEFVKVHQWVGDSAPADVKNGAPAPSTWSKPALYLPSDQCNIGSHFYDLQLVFSTNVCGKWPGELWHLDASYAGQAQSSAQATGVDSCYEYAHSHGAEWGNAFFEIASISIFE